MDSRRIGMRGRGEAVHSDKPGIDIVEQIGPDLADVCHSGKYKYESRFAVSKHTHREPR